MSNLLVITTLIFNCILGVDDRILQICYYVLTKNDNLFLVPTAQHIALTFILLPLALNFIIISSFVFFHHEQGITIISKIKSFFLYLISSEILLPMGIMESFKTKYSEIADNPLVSMKLLNCFHAMFISIPQLIIISVNSSANDEFKLIDIFSLIFSACFLVWSGVYYILCSKYEVDYDDFVTLTVYKSNND